MTREEVRLHERKIFRGLAAEEAREMDPIVCGTRLRAEHGDTNSRSGREQRFQKPLAHHSIPHDYELCFGERHDFPSRKKKPPTCTHRRISCGTGRRRCLNVQIQSLNLTASSMQRVCHGVPPLAFAEFRRT
jgi:hypothetical protein